MQPIVEPARGLCGNHKPNRFFGIERKRINGALFTQGSLLILKGAFCLSSSTTDIFYQAASIWNSLTEYQYIFTYGFKSRLYTINLTFSPEDFPHLAGFQYLKDISLPKYNPEKTVSKILDGSITVEQVRQAAQYEEMVLPRLEALVRIKDTLDNEFNLFSYMPRMYPFYTQIKADYIISSHSDITSFVFILQSTANGSARCHYLCCSAFKQGGRDYESNQRPRTLLKKERIHINSKTSIILMDKLSPPETKPDES